MLARINQIIAQISSVATEQITKMAKEAESLVNPENRPDFFCENKSLELPDSTSNRLGREIICRKCRCLFQSSKFRS